MKRFPARTSQLSHRYQPEFGITGTTAHERVRAVAADRTAARIIGLQPGKPVMQLRRTAFTFGDKPVEYRVSTIDTSRHDYVRLMSRPSCGLRTPSTTETLPRNRGRKGNQPRHVVATLAP